MPTEPAYIYRAKLDRIIDGDTAVFMVDLGFKTFSAVTVRVRGVDTPEVRGPTNAAGLAASRYSYNLLLGQQLLLASYKDRQSFARWVCDVWLSNGDSWAERLLRAGHAVEMAG